MLSHGGVAGGTWTLRTDSLAVEPGPAMGRGGGRGREGAEFEGWQTFQRCIRPWNILVSGFDEENKVSCTIPDLSLVLDTAIPVAEVEVADGIVPGQEAVGDKDGHILAREKISHILIDKISFRGAGKLSKECTPSCGLRGGGEKP